jgi:hypothetical protein
MKSIALCAAALFLAPTLASGAGSEDPAYEKLLAVCVGIPNAGDCARATEASHKDGATTTRYRRAGQILTVVSSNRDFVFRDGENPDGDIQYSYIAYLAKPAVHVIRRQYGEGNEFTVIGERDDRAEVVPGFPVLSPSATRFLSYSEAGESGYNADAIEVWRVTRGRLAREAKLEPNFSGCTIREVKWLSDVAVQLRGQPVQGSSRSKPCRISLRYSNARWVAE